MEQANLWQFQKSGDGTNWAEALTYDNIPPIKALKTSYTIRIPIIDIFVMGDETLPMALILVQHPP